MLTEAKIPKKLDRKSIMWPFLLHTAVTLPWISFKKDTHVNNKNYN